jgi:hypothetical protein
MTDEEKAAQRKQRNTQGDGKRKQRRAAKKTTAKKSALLNRMSTLCNALAHDLMPTPQPLSDDDTEARCACLNLNGLCEYCEIRAAGKGYGDHFYAVIVGKRQTVYCSDLWNSIPCCATCNSSKGNKSWKAWLTGTVSGNPLLEKTPAERERILKKFQRYDDVMLRRCQKKVVDDTFFDAQLAILKQVVEQVVRNVEQHLAAQESSHLASEEPCKDSVAVGH